MGLRIRVLIRGYLRNQQISIIQDNKKRLASLSIRNH